jgi:hypothetical protein
LRIADFGLRTEKDFDRNWDVEELGRSGQSAIRNPQSNGGFRGEDKHDRKSDARANKSDDEAYELLKLLGMPFVKKGQ